MKSFFAPIFKVDPKELPNNNTKLAPEHRKVKNGAEYDQSCLEKLSCK